jgi:hypothetical protein
MIRCLLLALALGLSVGNTEARADLPSITRLAFEGSGVFVAFAPQTTNWVAIEASPNLSTWTEVGNVATTNIETFFVDQQAALPPYQFYRLRQAGTTVDEARSRWPTNTNLSYEFQSTALTAGVTGAVSAVTATVTVAAGQKVISNAQANGQPIAQPNPDDFPSVQELFAALESARQTGCRQTWVIYDSVLGYPVECFIDRRAAANPAASGGQAVQYFISGLKVN